jgi:tetratricopeptide (TPR) repeat protein
LKTCQVCRQRSYFERSSPILPELIVTIEHSGDAYLAKTSRADGQEVCQNRFTFGSDQLVDLEPQWMLERAIPRAGVEPVMRQEGQPPAASSEADKLAAYGQRLFSFLFGDGHDLANFLKFDTTYRRQARLTLKLHDNAAGLWRLPWEYLHDGRDFLALHGRFQLSRVPYGLAELRPDPVALPLRLLVIIAAPDDQQPLDTEEEIGVIQAALDEAVRANRVQVEYLDDATLPAIGETLRRFRPHLLHFTGHGLYERAAGRSFLALESEDGRTQLAGIADLRPYLVDAPELRLVCLSGCQTAQTSPADAFSGVATGLLQSDLPAALAMQFSILDPSAIELARAFYSALAHGDDLLAAMQQARLALRDFADGPGYDWGIPALYLRAGELRLVDPTAVPPALPAAPPRLLDSAGLPLPPHFVGRKAELRQLRQALRQPQVNAAFIRGIGGMGKSSVAAKFLQRPGLELDGALVIRCNEVDPLDIPAKLAHFLAAQGRANHAEAAALILDSRLPPADRARQAAALVAERRYVVVFDNFESVMTPSPNPSPSEGNDSLPSPSEGEGLGVRVANPDLSALLTGLLQAQWRSLCIFTGRYRWTALDEFIGRGTALELHLPQLRAAEALMLMDNLPRLRREPRSTKIALYKKVGGHPKTIELLNGWLATGRVTDLLADPALDSLLARQWEDYFLSALLAHLPAAEREQLTRLSIFRTRLDDEEFTYAGVTPAARRRWLDLSLLQQEQVTGTLEVPVTSTTYLIHPVVREYLLSQLDPAARRGLHRWAAAFQGHPFVEIARAYATQSDQSWTEADIEALAREQVVRANVARTDDLPAAQAAMARALEWQHHLFAAGAYEAAGEIVTAVTDILARWGERDRTKALLRSSIETREGFGQAVAQGNLATLLQNEGKLAEALAIHEELYRTFEAQGAKQQIATALGQQSNVLLLMGHYDEAIEKQETALQIDRERGDEEGQAISLHQLAMLYRLQGDYPTALARSREAEALNRKLKRKVGIAANLQEQGLIHMGEARTREAPEQRQAAWACFTESLAINRRIGDEAGAADSLGELGKLLMEAEQMAEAIAAFNEALENYRRANNPAKMGIVLELLGMVHERQGHYREALEKYQQALALAQQYSSPQQRAIEEQHIARVQQRLKGKDEG